MSLSAETRPSNGIALFVAGGILLVLGVVGVVLYATGAPDAAGDGNPWRAVTIIGAAIAAGVGVLLVALGVVKRSSASRRRAS